MNLTTKCFSSNKQQITGKGNEKVFFPWFKEGSEKMQVLIEELLKAADSDDWQRVQAIIEEIDNL